MDDIFTLRGRLTTDGEGADGLFLIIVDEDDLDEDDLIALGTTDEDGGFKVSFLGSEFRQDTLELELTPDIKLIAAAKFDGVHKAIFERRFPDLDWDWTGGGDVDLGDIELEGVDLDDPTPLDGTELMPGYERRAIRLEIDDELVRACLAEVAPIVEHLTGWSDLLDDLNIEIADSLAPWILREQLRHDGTDPESLEADIMAFVTDYSMKAGAGTAMYDPGTHTMVVLKGVAEQSSLEGFKLVCGHELVHVGQHRFTPGLTAYNQMHQEWVAANRDQLFSEEGLARQAYMTQIEGYASYIEHDFLNKRFYRMALLSYHDTFCQKIVRGLFSLASGDVEKAREGKHNQYIHGIEHYRERQRGDVPARFDLDVAALPGGPEVLAALA